MTTSIAIMEAQGQRAFWLAEANTCFARGNIVRAEKCLCKVERIDAILAKLERA